MEEAMASRYWCHLCEQIVSPIFEHQQVDIKCPFCHTGFIEEMAMAAVPSPSPSPMPDALSLWAPILLGIMSHPRRRLHSHAHADADADADAGWDDSEFDSIFRSSRTSSATILQGIRDGLASDSQNPDRDETQRLLVNHTLLLEGGHNPIGSLGEGDYFIAPGPGLDLLLQHLADNDPNRYGTPPARKDAVESLPTVAIKDNLQCPVCLDDFEAGAEAKEMPCKHKFHSACLLPWLDLHSSCPVCRFQLPAEESKHTSDGWSYGNLQREIESQENSPLANGGGEEGSDGDGDGDGRNGRRFTFPWPFSGLFSSLGSQSNGGNSPSSSSPANANANANSGSASASSHTNESTH